MSYIENLEILNVRLTGLGSILMHCDRLVNPLDPMKKEIAVLTGKRKKTDEDHREISRLEWSAGMYHDDDIGPYLPGRMLKAMLIDAAKKSKEGPKVKSGLIVDTNKAKLKYKGLRDKVAMWESQKFTDCRPMTVQRSKIMRTRPIFSDWSCDFDITFDKTLLNQEDVIKFLELGGRMLGLGDSRVGNGGDYGRFEVTVLEELSKAA